MRIGVELFVGRTSDRTRVNETIKQANVSRVLFYHYFLSKMTFARVIVEYEVPHLHGLAERQTALTLEGVIPTSTGCVKARPNSPRTLHIGDLDQDLEAVAALVTSFERHEHLALMFMGIPEPGARAISAAHVWISTIISLCLVRLDHLEIGQETIMSMSARTLRSLASQVRQGVEHTPEPAVTPVATLEPVSNR